MSMPSGGCVLRISKRLQAGWTLLNEHCPMPQCGTPLLKDQKGKVYCVKCEMYCITADEAQSLGVPTGEARSSAKDNTRPDNSSSDSPAGNTGRDLSMAATSSTTTKQNSRAAAEARMGEKLLLGWTMLADECPTPGCCFPLMRDKDRKIACVACGGNGVAVSAAPSGASALDEGPSRAPVATVTAPPREPASSETSKGGDGVVSVEEFATLRKKRDALSAALGRYMLQGWSLSEKTCPREECEAGTPLLKDRSAGTLYCAGCDTRMSEGEDGVAVVETMVSCATPVKRDSSGQRRTLPLAAARAEPTAPVPEAEPMQVESEYELAEKARLRKQAAREQSNCALSASTGLAERLLQGWAMLSKPCPRTGCHSPLMRDRSGREVCVSCSTPASGREAGAAPVQAAGDVMGEMDMEEEDEEDRAMLDDGAGRIYAEQRMADLTTTATAAEGAIDRVRVKTQALDTLYRALDVSQQRLRSCSGVPADVDESTRQATLIAQLAMAARAVCDLPTGAPHG